MTHFFTRSGMFLTSLLLFCCLQMYGQTKLKGLVTDKTGGLPRVTVFNKTINKNTTTDQQGNFTLMANTGDILEFTSVGFVKQQVTFNGKDALTILMEEDSRSLNEVVAIGYGKQRKTNLTGAISVIDKKAMENRPVTNAVAALQGAAPGLVVTRSSGQPGQEGYNLNVRGFSSVNGTNSPLVIIDGAEGDLTLLNPYDIESVSVLKDAAAAAIYGAKAASGVVIVTTKKGVKGKTKVEYTALATMNRFHGLPETTTGYQQASMQNLAVTNAGSPATYSQQQLDWYLDPNINYVPKVNDPTTLDYYYNNVNKPDLVLRKGTFSQNHNLTISGGGDKTDYLIGLGYFAQDGIFKFGPDGTKRYNLRLNTNTKFNSIFSFDSRLSYTLNKTESPSLSVGGDGGLLYNIFTIRSSFPIYLPNSNDTKYSYATSANPVAILKDGGYTHNQQQNINGVFTLNAANFLKGFSLRMIYAPYIQQNNDDVFKRSVPLWTLAPTPAAYINTPNSYAQSRASIYSHDVQQLADYDLNINNAHHFHILGGFEYKYYNYNSMSAQLKSLISNDAPSLNYGSNPSIAPVISNDIQTNAWVSYFTRFNYDYKEKYLFEVAVRNDASSRLAPGHRDQTFPSLSAGWNISKEQWFEKLARTFNELKLRASWGNLGNAQLGSLNSNNYNYNPLLSVGPPTAFNNISNPSLYQANLPSPSLGWETIETSNAGLDLSLFNNRLTGSFDYFIRKNKNMLITVAEPAPFGLGNGYSNSASLKTWGWELNLGWKDRINSVNYFVNLNLADNQNKVTSYAGTSVYTAGLNGPLVGQPLNSIYGYIDEGYFTSAADVANHAFQDKRNGPGDIKYKDINGDHSINSGAGTAANHGDLVNLGNTSPRYVFGFSTGFSWKDLDFSVFFQGVGKAKILLNSAAIVPFAATYYQPWQIQEDYWTPDNPNARFPRPYLGGNSNTLASSHWVQNAAYIRLKNLQLGYSLPKKLAQKINVEKIRLFFTGQDLWESNGMWFNYYDAESPNNSYLNYPLSRSYALGLNVTF